MCPSVEKEATCGHLESFTHVASLSGSYSHSQKHSRVSDKVASEFRAFDSPMPLLRTYYSLDMQMSAVHASFENPSAAFAGSSFLNDCYEMPLEIGMLAGM